MARKWRSLFRAVHTVLRWKRWQRLSAILTLGCTIALFLSLSLAPISVQAQTDPAVEFEQGRQHYEAGKYTQAAQSLNAAIAIFAARDQPLRQAIALSNLALVHQALGEWNDAEAALTTGFRRLAIERSSLTDAALLDLEPDTLRIAAVLLNAEGKGHLQQGDAEAALAAWRQATQVYGALGDSDGQITSQINQLQALQSLGLFQQAQGLGDQIRVAIEAQDTSLFKAKGLLNFGNVERAIGQLTESEITLQESQTAAQPLANPELTSAIALSLGATYQALGDRETERLTTVNRQGLSPWVCSFVETPESAVPHYQDAIAQYQIADNYAPNQVAANLNRLMILQTLNRVDDMQSDWWRLQSDIKDLSPSRGQVFANINLAQRGACLKQARQDESVTWADIQDLLERAIASAQAIADPAAESYARGNLGGLYEYFATLETSAQAKLAQTKAVGESVTWRETAQMLTEQALFLAQPATLPDIAFQWQWQLARLAKAEGKPAEAIALYKQAVKTLEAVRGNLLTVDSDVQFSFRDNVEPVYRELVDLLFRDDIPSQSALEEVIGLIDSIQLAELESFLQCDLTGTVELTKADIPDTSAVLYTVMLADRLEVIVQLPNQTNLLHHRTQQPYTELNATLTRLRQELERDYITDNGESLAEEVYRWLLQPQETILASSGVDTLVFVLDSTLRNVPPAALRDAEGQYLIKKYAIALTPRLQLQTPQPLQTSGLDALFFGLAEIPEAFKSKFGPLPFVQEEAQQVDSSLVSQVFLNDQFTSEVLNETLQNNPAKVVHLATHGEFSSDPDETFILAWNKQINSNELNVLLRDTPANFNIELLVLSACKTANGDNRATLGLAGLALQAGAQSTVASLWTVDDAATAEFVGAFYQALTQSDSQVSRADALRRAQLQLLEKYQAPTYWVPFVLVGNWL